MQIVYSKNRKTAYLEGYENDIDMSLGYREVRTFLEAYKQGILPKEIDVFYCNGSKYFCYIKNNIMEIHYYRDNWNGYHDEAFYSLPDLNPIGTTYDMDSSIGRHRRTIVLE